ncbi:MAG: glycerol-3-phosphate 1-O-acyltransferase PlsY [Candidatus Pacebacteria bacterium]|nr:glycerol-3-phosphate 1-O-acyltransferase PlsY [Candidatus Paceibacterota bacterium]
MNFYVLFLLAYLIGSIPFGYLAGKINKINIKKVGSGSTGATNVSRFLGVKWAVLVALLDISKAGIPIYMAFSYLNSEWQIALIAIITIIGHIFPVWLKFKGGKGVSTLVPSLIAFGGLIPTIILILFWAVLLKTTKTMSLDNVVLIFLVPFMFWFHTYSVVYFSLGVILFLIILYAHRENIYRLYNKEELKL